MSRAVITRSCGPEGEEGANKAVTVAGAPLLLLLRAESFRAMAASNCCTLSTLAADEKRNINYYRISPFGGVSGVMREGLLLPPPLITRRAAWARKLAKVGLECKD